MNVRTLVFAGEADPKALACGACGLVYSLTETDRAEQCCAPYLCTDCGNETERRYYTLCDSCRKRKDAEEEHARFAAATVVEWTEDAGAMLYDAEHDRWIHSEEDAEEADPPTRYAYATTPLPLSFDADDLIENALESGPHYDDASDDISVGERNELQVLLDAWAKSTGIVSWMPDYSRVVVFEMAPTPEGGADA